MSFPYLSKKEPLHFDELLLESNMSHLEPQAKM